MASRRTSVLLDEESSSNLRELQAHYGSQTEVFRASLANEVERVRHRRGKEAFARWVTETYGPVPKEDSDWAEGLDL